MLSLKHDRRNIKIKVNTKEFGQIMECLLSFLAAMSPSNHLTLEVGLNILE
jgi:hypothetical protein